MLETVEFFFHLEAVLKFVDINFMSCFRGCPVLLFEKDSGSYLTEKRRTGQTGKSRKRIFDKFQNSFLESKTKQIPADTEISRDLFCAVFSETPRYRLLFNITDEAAVSSGG